MPVSAEDDPSKHKAPLDYYDSRGTLQADGKRGEQYEIDPGDYVGWNGYANLVFDKDKLSIEYLNLKSKLLFKEEFETGAKGSIWYGTPQAPVRKPVR